MRIRPKAKVNGVYSITAPAGGLDDQSPIADMPELNAVSLLNWFPRQRAIEVRGGYKEHVTGLTGIAKTIMVYRRTNGTNQLLAATDSGIYDITTSTATPTLVKAITNGQCYWTQFSNLAGNWLVVCNGTDAAMLYDGTSWIDFTNTGSPVTPGQVTGPAVATLVVPHQHKDRLWFLVNDSLSAYYLPLNAVAGALTEFPLGGILTNGGHLEQLFSWSINNGNVLTDVLIMQSSEGETVAYAGEDPDNAATWTVQARYFLGFPLSRHSHAPVNGDMLILTNNGLIPLSTVAQGGYRIGDPQAFASFNINRGLLERIQQTGRDQHWLVEGSPGNTMVILNCPDLVNTPLQYVMNTVTGAWCQFDLPARTFLDVDGIVYFSDASAGRVLIYGNGVSQDNVLRTAATGVAILASAQQAYNYVGANNVLKSFKMVRLTLECVGAPSYLVALASDFNSNGVDLVATPADPLPEMAAHWDLAVWDVDTWDAITETTAIWQVVTGISYAGSICLKVRAKEPVRWVFSQYVFEGSLAF